MTKSIDGERVGSKAYHEAMLKYITSDPIDHEAGEQAVKEGQACRLIAAGSSAFVLAINMVQRIRKELRKAPEEDFKSWVNRYRRSLALWERGWKVGDQVSVYMDGQLNNVVFTAAVKCVDLPLSRLKVIYACDGSEQWVPMEWCSFMGEG